MKGIERGQDRDTLVVVLAMVFTLFFIFSAALILSGVLPNNRAQLLMETIVGAASVTLALATVSIYRRQNKIIDDQHRATVQAQKASVQTLDMAATDSGQDLVVELSNSGGGAARNLCGKVDFAIPEFYGVDIEPYTVTGRRRSLTRDRSDSRTWVASEGNTIAAGEEQVPIEIQCAVEHPEYETPLGFPAAVREFANDWCAEQLSRIESALSADELEEIGEKWGEQVFFDMADSPRVVNPNEIGVYLLYQISVTLAESEYAFTESDILEMDIRLQVRLQYVDEYLEGVGQDATFEVAVLDTSFPIERGTTLDDIFENYSSNTYRQDGLEEGAFWT